MRSIVLLLLLALIPVQAQTSSLVVQPILLRRSRDQVDIRTEVRNVAGAAVETSYQVRLLARTRASEPWRLLQSWDLGKLPAGQQVDREYIPVPPGDPALGHRHPHLRAEVWMNDHCESSTETVWQER
ncbi:MAG TPA: hypothetical protein VGO93_20050 [Candidatus Xenobia bacterium]|jgi:hypothetical protein